MPTPKKIEKSGNLSPLWIISLFISLIETISIYACTQTEGNTQSTLLYFSIVFAFFVTLSFFTILAFRPFVFYSPKDLNGMNIKEYIELNSSLLRFEKTTTKTSDLDATKVTVVGNPDNFKLLFKVVGPDWKKSTKAMQVKDGCLIQVSTEIMSANGIISIAEAITFVPNTKIIEDPIHNGYCLDALE